ncbi:MAG: hypothetical protein MORG_03721 [Morganella sp. (in: enterobacteria)]
MMLYWQPLGSKKENAADAAKELKGALDAFSASGKSLTRSQKNYPVLPSDYPKSTKSWLTPKPPKRPRPQNVYALKSNGLMQALAKGNAANPEAISKILLENVTVGEK